MRYLLPRSLAGRTVMVLVAGLIVTHIVTVVVFSEHRADSLTRAEEQHMAQHIASVADIVLNVPNQWRDRIVRSSDNHAFRVYMTSSERGLDERKRGATTDALSVLVSRQMRAALREPILIDIQDGTARSQMSGFDLSGRWLREQFGRLIYGHDRDKAVLVSIPLSQNQRLNFSTVMPLAYAPGWERTLAITGSFLIAVALLSLWAVKKLSVPLDRFASATTAFAHNVNAPPLPESGPSEVRQAATAFNDMQRQIRKLLENRARMLAAISHDLRTPLTTVRLRAERVTDPELRSKMLAALSEMEAMLSSALAFAREGSESEENSMTDVGSLVEAICEDMSDAGHRVTCAVDEEIVSLCCPLALKRALTNLIDNAVKYGKSAYVRVKSDDEAVEIMIEDEGPGIPETEMERIFLPFFRLEASRSRDTGGVGLGMAIAQMVIDSHSGSVCLNNRAEGGLCVRVRLPHSGGPETRVT